MDKATEGRCRSDENPRDELNKNVNAGSPDIILAGLDFMRSRGLRVLAKSSLWRQIFVNRTQRHLAGYFITAGFFLLISLFFPLYLLVFSPLAFGAAHLLTSWRYSSQLLSTSRLSPQESKGRSFQVIGVLALVMIILRAFLPVDLFYRYPWLLSNWLEVSASAILFFALLVFLKVRREEWRSWTGSIVALITLAALMWFYPLMTIGVLAFGHNVLAFQAWDRFAIVKGERHVVAIAFGFFIGVHGLLLTGVFDFIPNAFNVERGFADSVMGFREISGYFGVALHPVWFYRLTVAFAFAQAVHYFIWLRAIPELNQRQNVPLSFRQSYRWWRREVGWFPLAATVVLALVFPTIWFFQGLAAAQLTYFAISGFHGYWELIAVFRPAPRVQT